ncbi:MAG: restriction endonuclease subunit S [Nitrospirota bacterium]
MKKGWQKKTLGDVLVKTETTDPARSPQTEFDYIDVSSVSNETLAIEETQRLNGKDAPSRARRLVKANDVLFATIRPTLRRIAIVPEELDNQVCSTGYFVLRAKPDVDHRFVFYFLQTEGFMTAMEKLQKGASYPAVTDGDVRSQQIPIPPLPEQQRIVGILDEAFDGIATATANAERNLHNARALFESHLQTVFTQRGEGWTETTLEEVLAIQPQNGWSPPAANHSDSGTPVLTLSSVTGFRFRPDKRKFTSASTDSRRNYWVKNGDFLITRSNTPELVGHVAIASRIEKPTIYPDLIMRMNPAPDRIMTEFLYYQMRSPSLRKEITGRAQGANPTMKKISNGAVQTLPIAVPSIPTQRAIVRTLNVLAEETQRLESIYQQKLAALEALKKSLLHQAFSGEL